MKLFRIANFIVGLTLGLSMIAPVQAATHTERHTFSIGDVQGDFVGQHLWWHDHLGRQHTGRHHHPLRCPGQWRCAPASSRWSTEKLYGQSNPITLYPIDSEFGYYIIDFLGAAQKDA